MNFNMKFFTVLFLVLCFNIAVVSASDINVTETVELNASEETEEVEVSLDEEYLSVNDDNETEELTSFNSNETYSADNSTASTLSEEKSNLVISIKSKNVRAKDSLEIYLKDSNGNPLKNKQIKTSINGKTTTLKTNSKGTATLGIDLASKSYTLTVSFGGDNTYNNISKSFTINVLKIPTKIIPLNNFVVKKGHIYVYLYTSGLTNLAGKKLTITFNGKKSTVTTNKHGFVNLNMKLSKGKYYIKFNFKGDNTYKASSKLLKFYSVSSMSFRIGNSKLLTNGFLRVYLHNHQISVAKKTIKLYINGKKISKKTNSEGIVIVKPKLKPGTYLIKARFGNCIVSKKIVCYKGNVKDPLKNKIPLVNGVPDVDVMPNNYVMADENAKYTLKKSQYRDVMKRDSYCLYKNKKLSRYTFFKTKDYPNLNHIVKRGKWNVIEREINKVVVSVNKHNYWPSQITVSLRGKAYVYSEVRDVQDTDYTCGPAASSVCSQVLRDYICESYLAKHAHSKPYVGTSCTNLKYVLDKHNFLCSFFYRSTFSTAIHDLKEGGCGVVFHAYNHYVAVLDISKDGKYLLVSNSYGTFDNIPTGWVKTSYLKTKFYKNYDDGLIIKLNYKLSKAGNNKIDCFYNSMGTNWSRQNMAHTVGRV